MDVILLHSLTFNTWTGVEVSVCMDIDELLQL